MEDEELLGQIKTYSKRFDLTSLSELQAQIFSAHWDFGLTRREIADLLDKKISHIRVELSRISKKMDNDHTIMLIA